MFPKRGIHVGGFYARDNIRGRTHVREVTEIYTDALGVEQVNFRIHNLVGQDEAHYNGTTMVSFQKWVQREAVNKHGHRDTSRNQRSFEGDFIVYQFSQHPDAPNVTKARSHAGVTVEGVNFTVRGGRMFASMGGFQFHDTDNQPFACGYDSVDRITKLNGTVIWQNRHGSWKE
jgi:hypothetical protein